MITQPLTSNEEETLRQFKKLVQNLNPKFDRIEFYDANNEILMIIENQAQKDTWLNILKMAERANEIVTEQWNRSAKSIVRF